MELLGCISETNYNITQYPLHLPPLIPSPIFRPPPHQSPFFPFQSSPHLPPIITSLLPPPITTHTHSNHLFSPSNLVLRRLAPTLHIPYSITFQAEDLPIVPTTSGTMWVGIVVVFMVGLRCLWWGLLWCLWWG